MKKQELIKHYEARIDLLNTEIEKQEGAVSDIKSQGGNRQSVYATSDYMFAKMALSRSKELRANCCEFINELSVME
jgi:hypothetical protein